MSYLITSRKIKPILNNLIHSDQKGFVAGRYIGEVIRTTNDIIEYAKDNNVLAAETGSTNPRAEKRNLGRCILVDCQAGSLRIPC